MSQLTLFQVNLSKYTTVKSKIVLSSFHETLLKGQLYLQTDQFSKCREFIEESA